MNLEAALFLELHWDMGAGAEQEGREELSLLVEVQLNVVEHC